MGYPEHAPILVDGVLRGHTPQQMFVGDTPEPLLEISIKTTNHGDMILARGSSMEMLINKAPPAGHTIPVEHVYMTSERNIRHLTEMNIYETITKLGDGWIMCRTVQYASGANNGVSHEQE